MGKHFNENLMDKNFKQRKALVNPPKSEPPLYVKDSDKPEAKKQADG